MQSDVKVVNSVSKVLRSHVKGVKSVSQVKAVSSEVSESRHADSVENSEVMSEDIQSKVKGVKSVSQDKPSDRK